MEPKYVIYECENCGRMFYREVADVVSDDVDDCHVHVTLVPEAETGEIEEFPMCGCIGGKLENMVNIFPN